MGMRATWLRLFVNASIGVWESPALTTLDSRTGRYLSLVQYKRWQVGERTEGTDVSVECGVMVLQDFGGNKLLCHQIGAAVSGRFQG
jgi:hypothetical protein